MSAPLPKKRDSYRDGYGTIYRYENGKLHNEKGPAVTFRKGVKVWFLNGKRYTEQEWRDEMFKRCFHP